jgi:hypothetical protein
MTRLTTAQCDVQHRQAQVLQRSYSRDTSRRPDGTSSGMYFNVFSCWPRGSGNIRSIHNPGRQQRSHADPSG